MTFSSWGRLASTRERTNADVARRPVRSVFRYPPEVRTNARERTLIRVPAVNERARTIVSHVRSKQIFESATRRARASSGCLNKDSGRKKVRLETRILAGGFARRERTWLISYGHRPHIAMTRGAHTGGMPLSFENYADHTGQRSICVEFHSLSLSSVRPTKPRAKPWFSYLRAKPVSRCLLVSNFRFSLSLECHSATCFFRLPRGKVESRLISAQFGVYQYSSASLLHGTNSESNNYLF